VEHDQRDRRDSADAEDASSLPPDSTQPPDESTAAPDAESAPTTPDEQIVTAQPVPADDSWKADESAPVDDTATWQAPTEEAAQAPSVEGADAAAGTADTERWPSQDASPDSPAWPTEPPAAGSTDAGAWPTEPPAAESTDADAGAWPTSPSERGDEPIREPEWSDATPAAAAIEPTGTPEWSDADATQATAEPPPSEVEAYPAAAGAAETATAAGLAAHSVPAAESATGESTQCPRCGTENRPGLAFCRNCGQRLVAAGVASTVERPGTPEGTMACPRCGTHNRAGVAFCQNCGANLRGTAAGYVPPAVAADGAEAERIEARRGGAVLGPVVLLIGLVGIVTGYLLPFLYGSGSLFDRALGSGGYGAAFWSAYPDVSAQLADQAYFGLAAPVPVLGLILLALAVAGFARATPGPLQTVGLGIALLWSVGLIVLFLVVELAGNWDGDLVGMLRVLTPAGIIFFLSSLIILIGTLTRFGRS
jgi:hypothetical protein